MTNDPLSQQMTVAKLRLLLRDLPDDVVVTLVVPAGGVGHPTLDTIHNLKAEYSGGPVLKMFICSLGDGSR